nr:SDR family NAD(P)-dependent oxidoreductase [Chitinophagaceae bacterium]
MSDLFKNKVVAITGGSEGIGKALVNAFLQRGAKVATCGRHEDKLNALLQQHPGKPLHIMVADVSVESDCKKFINSTIDKFGAIDMLVNNAGISMRALVQETEIETLKKVMDINFWGTVFC